MALLPTDKKQQNTLMVGVIALVLAFGFYFFRYKKMKAEFVAKEANILVLTDVVDALKAKKARYGNLDKQMAIYEQHMKRLEELIPQRQDVPALLYAIAEQAQLANIAYGGIKPTLSEPVAYYSRELYDITVSGTYHDIGAYIAGIASLPRIIKVGDMRMIVDANAKPRADGAPTVKATFSIETYVIPAPGEVKADPPKRGA
ncbi:MAG: type 4a pilus biogenesis protein PilO [Longimicrobiales bacterium]